METLWLHICAPFATYSTLRTGTYRDTMPVMPPSAAYGLILNLAGIEIRGSLKKTITPIRSDLPTLRLAFGRVAGTTSEVSVLLQNMHNYPVGASGKERKAKAHGTKYWIEPTYREIIVNLDMMLGIQADPKLISRIRQGLNGKDDPPRYGLPFAGDNNFLFDEIIFWKELKLVFWIMDEVIFQFFHFEQCELCEHVQYVYDKHAQQ